MLSNDPISLATVHQDDLLAEAERDRLAALLPAKPSAATHARRAMAEACMRLAAWLDAPEGYVQIPEAGPEDWVTPWASV